MLNESIKKLKYDYLNKKVISIKYNEPVNVEIKDLNILKHKADALKVQVDTSKQDIEEVLERLIKLGKVDDIVISDPPLEEIISFIYKQNKEGGIDEME